MHLLQFVNYYASIIYAGFLKGLSVGSPGGHDHLFGSRHEEDYEARSDALNEAMKYASHIEPVRTSLTSKLKVERRLVGECLQGDLLYIHKQSTEKSLTPALLNKLLSHKKRLLKHEAYTAHKTWMGQSYHKQFLLPSTHVRKLICESTTVKVLSTWERNEKLSSYSMLNFAKFVWENSGKLMMLVLTTQVAAIQAFHNSSQMDLVSEGNVTDSFSRIPILVINTASFNIMSKNTSELAEIHQYVDISNEVLQKILHQSYTIINDLQEIVNYLSSNKDTNRLPEKRFNLSPLRRVVRSLPIEESNVCEIEQDTLINLRNELQATLEQPNEGVSNNCQLNFDSDRCEELIKLVLCGYSHLRDAIIAARENVSEAIIMVNKLAEFKEQYMRLLDSIKQSHSQEYNMMKTKFETELQEQKNLLNTWISLLREQKIKSCISEISSGKIESAIQDFQSLNEDSVLSKIIRSVYIEYGNLSQVDNIVNFIKKLPRCVQHNITYTVLYDEMHKKDQLSSPKVLVVAHAAKFCMGGNFMKPYARGVIDAWAPKARINKDNAQIIDFARKHGYAFRAYLTDLIDKAYANELSNVENVIMFVCKLPYIDDYAVGYSSLFDKMRSNGHVDSYETLILAEKIKESMEMPNYPNLWQYYKDMFNILKSNLPNSVKGLIWSNRNSCTIFNVYYEEYLYAANDYFNYAAYTWVEGVKVTSALWKLDMMEGGKLFKIINTHYRRPLFSSQEIHNYITRYLNTGTCGNCADTNWKLKPHGENFLIWNPHHENYIYCGTTQKDSNRRFVFGWILTYLTLSLKMKMLWRIDC